MLRLDNSRRDISRVLTSGASDPPDNPESGDAHIVGDQATGAWQGQDRKVALFLGSRWHFHEAEEGDSVWAVTGAAYTYHEGSWLKTYDIEAPSEIATTTPTPNAVPKAGPTGVLDGGWVPPGQGGGGGGIGVVLDILSYADTVNKVIGPLSSTPLDRTCVGVTVMGGPDQQYTQDYTVREVTGGSAPGHYICIDPGSTAPGGGAFAGGTNPGTGISATLAASDKVKTTYSAE